MTTRSTEHQLSLEFRLQKNILCFLVFFLKKFFFFVDRSPKMEGEDVLVRLVSSKTA